MDYNTYEKIHTLGYNRNKATLDRTFYNFGKQQFDFSVQIISGNCISKRRNYTDLCFNCDDSKNQWFIEHANQRQILPNEIVLDLEEEGSLESISEKLKESGIDFDVYATGSKGHHFHLWFDDEVSDEDRIKLAEKFKADTQKTKNTMIALENCPHWKSGKIKVKL